MTFQVGEVSGGYPEELEPIEGAAIELYGDELLRVSELTAEQHAKDNFGSILRAKREDSLISFARPLMVTFKAAKQAIKSLPAESLDQDERTRETYDEYLDPDGNDVTSGRLIVTKPVVVTSAGTSQFGLQAEYKKSVTGGARLRETEETIQIWPFIGDESGGEQHGFDLGEIYLNRTKFKPGPQAGHSDNTIVATNPYAIAFGAGVLATSRREQTKLEEPGTPLIVNLAHSNSSDFVPIKNATLSEIPVGFEGSYRALLAHRQTLLELAVGELAAQGREPFLEAFKPLFGFVMNRLSGKPDEISGSDFVKALRQVSF